MQRFMTFVNGSNLFTAFKHIDLYIDDYEDLFHYVFEQSVDWWRSSLSASFMPPAQHVRVYWHVVDSMDDWDFSNPKTRQHLSERFLDDRELRNRWVSEVTHATGNIDPGRIEQAAFNMCLEDSRNWYEKRQNVLSGMNRFHHAVESSMNLVELCRCGRWKVDVLHKTVIERGLDVCFAVDTVALIDQYDMAVLIGADTDGGANLDYLKRRGKQVAVVELLKGYPSEVPERGFATPLKVAADFVVPIYEMELVKRQIATRGAAGDTMAFREAS